MGNVKIGGAKPLELHREDNIQKQIVTYCRIKKILVFAPITENTWGGMIRKTLIATLGKARGLQIAAKLISQIVNRNKTMGQLKGVTDLVVVLQGGKTVFIELKNAKGKLSADQEWFGSELAKRDHRGYVCRSLDAFIEILEAESSR